MAKITFNDYLKQTDSKQTDTKEYPVKFFKVAEGEVAIVRFYISSMNDIDLFDVHKVGEFPDTRTVSCLRHDRHDKLDLCPFCRDEVGKKQRRAFVKLLKYEENEDGSITTTPCKWERSGSTKAGFVDMMKGFVDELGDLTDIVFKVTRKGSGLDTKYQIIPFANQAKYPESKYPKDFSELVNYGSAEDYNIKEYTKEEMEEIIETGEWPAPKHDDTDDEGLDLVDDETVYAKPAFTPKPNLSSSPDFEKPRDVAPARKTFNPKW